MSDCECPIGADWDDDTDVCESTNPDGKPFVCTRPAGHDGQHKACAMVDADAEEYHPVATWESEE